RSQVRILSRVSSGSNRSNFTGANMMTCLASVRRCAVATLVAVSFGVLGGCESSNKNGSGGNGAMTHATPVTPSAQATPRAQAAAPATPAAPAVPAAAAVPATPAAPAQQPATTFGASGKLSDAQAITVPELMSNVDQYKHQYVRVTGTVD